VMIGEARAEEIIQHSQVAGLDLMPSNIDLAGAEIEMVGVVGRETILKEALQPVMGGYDYVLVDCPPSLGLLTLNALTTVKEVFIPLQTEFFALQGLGRLMSTVQLVRSVLTPEVEITGIIASMFDVRTSLAVEVLQDIKEHFGDKVFDTVVRKNIRLAEAPSFGIPIILYDAACYGAEDYRSLAQETVAMEGAPVETPVQGDVTPPLPAGVGAAVPLAQAG